MNTALADRTVRVWKQYLAAMPSILQPELAKNLHVYGFLPVDLTERCAAAIQGAPEADYDAKSFRSAWSPMAPENKAKLLASHAYKALDARTAWALWDVLTYLAEPVAALVGAKWRLLNTRTWISRPGAASGPYDWHTDGEPEGMFKIMVYWSALSDSAGGLEVDTGNSTSAALRGRAGLWVLFANSVLSHRALAPLTGERLATEFTLCPWPRMDIGPHTMGANVRHPIYPLVNAKDML